MLIKTTNSPNPAFSGRGFRRAPTVAVESKATLARRPLGHPRRAADALVMHSGGITNV